MNPSVAITRKAALELYGGSQAELARALGCHRQQINAMADDRVLPRWMSYKLRYELIPALVRDRVEATLGRVAAGNDPATELNGLSRSDMSGVSQGS